MIKVAFFDAKAYDKPSFEHYGSEHDIHDDAATGEKSKLRSNASGVRSYDAYLAILQLDKKEVKRLATDRSIKPILEKLHDSAQDSFPDRQGIELILRGEIVSYERVRKWLVLLTFYTYWARNQPHSSSRVIISRFGKAVSSRSKEALIPG